MTPGNLSWLEMTIRSVPSGSTILMRWTVISSKNSCPGPPRATAVSPRSVVVTKAYRTSHRVPCFSAIVDSSPCSNTGGAGKTFRPRVPAQSCAGSEPPHPLPQRGHMGHVVIPMPGVQAEDLVEGHLPPFGMPEGLPKVGLRQRAQQGDPAAVQVFQQGERDLDRHRARVGELGPAPLVVGLDHGLVLGQCQLAAGGGAEMAVRHVMDELAHGPAARSVWSVELLGIEA